MTTIQESELAKKIGRICAERDPGDVLAALLENTIDALRRLDKQVRDEVESLYIKTLVLVSVEAEGIFGPSEIGRNYAVSKDVSFQARIDPAITLR